MLIYRYILFIMIISLATNCQNGQKSHGHSHDVISGGPATEDHEHETGTLSYTLFSDKLELFVEFPVMMVGHTCAFAAHFTDMEDYSPVAEGRLAVSMIRDGKGIRHSVDTPTSPGIFRPALQPKESGWYDLIFELDAGAGIERFDVGQVMVYADETEASQGFSGKESGDEITFLKEQAWKTEFQTVEINPRPFYSVIHTSARVKNQPQSEISINAQASGIVQLFKVVGEPVKKGDLVALVTGSGIENNLSIKLSQSRIDFEKSKADYLRSRPLAESQVISQKDFLEISSRYMQDSIRYFQMANMISQNGLRVTAPFNGFISFFAVSNGDFLGAGQLIGKISGSDRLLIEAYVDQSDYIMAQKIFDARFKIPGNDKAITLQDLDGRLISSNVFVSSYFTRIPVSFQAINNGLLMPGMFLEAFLLTEKKDNALVVPLSAVIEEQGHYYVYVQTGGESFVKRPVELDHDDGLQVGVQAGLEAGERVVTKGAYQIKLASLSGDLPLHGHTH